jgi:uncharacterized YigZ family protein
MSPHKGNQMEVKYKTILNEYESELVEKKSRFICMLLPIQSEADAKNKIEGIKKRYYDARHHCSAYIIEDNPLIERGNDDGEPSGTAGMPMLEVLRGKGLRNVLVVVVRYFGGTLLGTGGLIRAYTNSVKECLEKAAIVEKKICRQFIVKTDYVNYGKIEYEIHRMGQTILNIEYGAGIELKLIVDLDCCERIIETLTEISSGQCEIENNGDYYVVKLEDDIILEKTNNTKLP